MKLFRILIQHEFLALAKDTDDALALAKIVLDEKLEPPAEIVALETRRYTDVPEKWIHQPPYVSPELTTYEPKAEDTSAVMFNRLYLQKPEKKTGKSKDAEAAK